MGGHGSKGHRDSMAAALRPSHICLSILTHVARNLTLICCDFLNSKRGLATYAHRVGTASHSDDLRLDGDSAESAEGSVASGIHAAVRLGAAVPRAAGVPREAAAFRDNAIAAAEVAARIDGPAALPKPKFSLEAVPTAPMAAVATEPGRISSTSLVPSIAKFSRFELLGRLAMGGMAEIFLARESVAHDLTRNVVVKVLRKPARGRESEGHFEQLFLREGRVAAQLMHPNICHVYEFGRHHGRYFIAMEYVEGASLRDLLSKVPGHRIDPLLCAWLFGQIASALHYAHTARDARRRPLGVVHRDVSPQNIMVRGDGIVKLLDFGVAHVGAVDDTDRAGLLFGKLSYMAPEQCRGATKIDGRADVFALGVCLYEALTGRRLYRRKDDIETVRALLEEPVPPLKSIDASLPEGLCQIVSRALAKKPEHRFASADEMRQALDRFVAKSGRTIGPAEAATLMSQTFAHQLSSGPLLTTELDLAELTGPSPDALNDTSSLAPPPLHEQPSAARTLSLRGAVLLALVAAVAAWMASRANDAGSGPTRAAQIESSQAVQAPPAAPIEPAASSVKARPEPAVPKPMDSLAQQPRAPASAEEARPEGPNEGSAPRETRTLPRPGFIKNAGF